MSAPAVLREVRPQAADADVAVAERIGDFRFRGLLSPADWAALPQAVRHRFSKRLAGAATAIYTGHVTVCTMSRTGWLLAQALRIIGAPLPLARQYWTADRRDRHGRPCLGRPELDARLCAQERLPAGHPLDKAVFGFDGARGIHRPRHPNGADAERRERHARIHERRIFHRLAAGSASACRAGWRRVKTVVTHRETAGDEFLFTLDLSHPWFGTLIRQEALYSEVQACSGE